MYTTCSGKCVFDISEVGQGFAQHGASPKLDFLDAKNVNKIDVWQAPDAHQASKSSQASP